MKVRAILVTLLAIALFGWFLRGTDLGAIWSQVRGAEPGYLVLALVVVGVSYAMRAVRWQCLLRPIGTTRFRTAFRTTVIGFAALALLPARAGDVLRPYLLARHERLSIPATLATVVMERVLDLVAVLLLLAAFVWGIADDAQVPTRLLQPIKTSAMAGGLVAVVMLAVSWVLASHPERVGGLVRTADRILPHALAHKLASWASLFSGGFAAARDMRGLALAVFWSFPIWLSACVEIWAVARSFGIEVPFPGTFLVQAMVVVGVAVPTPGGVGGFHEMFRLGMTGIFGAPNEAAVAAAIVLHLISFGPAVIVGFMFMAQDGLSFGRLREMAGEAREGEA